MPTVKNMKNTQLNSIRWDLNWMTYQTFCSNAVVVFTWHKICINTAKKKDISYQFSWGKYFRDTIGLYCFFSVSKQVVDKNISSSRIRLKVFQLHKWSQTLLTLRRRATTNNFGWDICISLTVMAESWMFPLQLGLKFGRQLVV